MECDLPAGYLHLPKQEFKFGTWYPIETAPKDGKTMFVVIGFGVRGGTYNTDPYAVWKEGEKFVRWPHDFEPTHWTPLPPNPTK